MNPLGTRARTEELAHLLNGTLEGPDTTGSAPLAPLTGLATRVRGVAPALEARAVPRPEFRAALRTRLVAVATVQAATLADAPAPKVAGSAISWTASRKAQRRIGVTAGALAGVVAFTGVGIAASRSLPGQALYGLKLSGENLQLRLTHGDTERGSKHLDFAATRLREVTALVHGKDEVSLGAPGGGPVAAGFAFSSAVQHQLHTTLGRFNSETRSGRALLEHAYRTTGTDAPLHLLTTFSTAQEATLAAILPDLPAAAREEGMQSLRLVQEVGSTARDLLSSGTCNGACPPPALPSPGVPGTAQQSGTPWSVASQDASQPPAASAAPRPSRTVTRRPVPTSVPTGLPTRLPTVPPLPVLPGPLPTVPAVPAVPAVPVLPGVPKP